MTGYGATPEEDGGLDALFEGSPDREVHTSASAETGFLLGIVALCAAPFTTMYAVALGLGVMSVVLALVGMATTSRPNVAGRALVPIGFASACTALLLVGLRYLGLDTAFADELSPTISSWLENLNGYVPSP